MSGILPQNRKRVERDFNPAALYSKEAECAVLGSMLAQPQEVIDSVNLTKQDFFVPAHQEIFTMLTTMHNDRIAIDVMTCHQWLTDRKLAESLGSPGILAELLVGFATHLNFSSYTAIVRDKAAIRNLQTTCSTIVQDIADMPDSIPAVIDRAESAITTLCGAYNATLTGFSLPGVVMDAELARIVSYDGRRPFTGIPTGFHKLDELTGGWHAGEMIVLAARPGVGKTSLALDFAHHAARAKFSDEQDTWIVPGHVVGFESIEMVERELDLRRLAKHSGIPLQKLRIGLTDEKERTQLRLAREEMRSWPIIIRDPNYLSLNQCRSLSRKLKREYKIELLIIDYLQLMTSQSSKQSAENRQNEVAEISRGIKGLAKELEIPIIILAQLNRKSAETKAAPALHNLRESGAIEQDADVVLLLHRPDAGEDEPQRAIPTVIPHILSLAKQRNGPTDDIPINFDCSKTRFDDPVRFSRF